MVMFFGLSKMLSKTVNKDEIAAFLQTNPEALNEFEHAYGRLMLDQGPSDNFFEINAKQAAQMHDGISQEGGCTCRRYD